VKASQASTFLNKSGRATFSSIWLPFVFEKIEVGVPDWVYVPLNHFDKPLGIKSRAPIDLCDYVASRGVKFASNPLKFMNVWWGEYTDDAKRLYLYDHSSQSKLDYFERLETALLKASMLHARLD
jgi:hypothetical protein